MPRPSRIVPTACHDHDAALGSDADEPRSASLNSAATDAFEAFSELKAADRAALDAMPPDEAQAAADAVLQPRLWQIADRQELVWQGSLADDAHGGTEAMESFALADLAAVFRALQAAGWDAILIGGQAVNLWAGHYEEDLPAWRELRPFTSRDLDYYGGLAEARLAMRVLHARGQLNTSAAPSPNAGVLKVPLAQKGELILDILTGVYGVSAAELERMAVTFSGTGHLSDLTLRVIHPLLLLEGKAAALRGLPQGGRQDAKHLRILVLVVHHWLRQQLGKPRAVFRVVERLAAHAASPDGLHAFAQGIDLVQAVPLDEMRAAKGYATFLGRRLPQLQEKIAQKRRRHIEAIRAQEPLP